jgi:hypothetical protein
LGAGIDAAKPRHQQRVRAGFVRGAIELGVARPFFAGQQSVSRDALPHRWR